MLLVATRAKTGVGLAGLLLALLGVLAGIQPARADLYSASSEYKKGDDAHALPDFLVLAKLGQPQAQLDVALMYAAGRGTAQSDVHAYAWALLAAQNGEKDAKTLADIIRPRLAPGSEGIAASITAPYTPAALGQRLLPVALPATGEAHIKWQRWVRRCYPVTVDDGDYPLAARFEGIEGNVFVAFTLMPDGRARAPRIILDMPRGVFGTATRESILNDQFAPLPFGFQPIHCVSFYSYLIGAKSALDYYGLTHYVDRMHRQADAGDPNSQLLYGMALVGLPQLNGSSDAGYAWFLRAAQAGLPLAQFQVGYDLLMGLDCQRDTSKAITWLHMAAEQNEPNAEVMLAVAAMSGSLRFGDLTQARSWLEKAAAQRNHDGELYLSALLAAAPDPGLRDPPRALQLVKTAFKYIGDDPTAFEIRAAAQAAEGEFAPAVKTEKKAIRRAHHLGWDVSPLQARLAAYQAGKPWYGNLLDF